MVQTVALASPAGDSLTLRILDFKRGVFTTSEWPREWLPLRDRLLSRLAGARGEPFAPPYDAGTLIEIPSFARNDGNEPFVRRESHWLVVELDADYLTNSLIPELLRRDLGDTALQDYDFEVFARSNPHNAICVSAAARTFQAEAADASAPIFEAQARPRHGGPPRFEHGPMPPGPPPRPAGAEGRPPPPGHGGFRSRWLIAARHRAGSLDSAVARTRTRNLAVSSAMLVLILTAGGALVRFNPGRAKTRGAADAIRCRRLT